MELIDKAAVKAEIDRQMQEYQSTGDDYWFPVIENQKNILSFLDTLEVKEVNIAEMADDYYDALMEEAAVWMDEGTMCHCRLAYYTGCKDVLNKLQKGE